MPLYEYRCNECGEVFEKMVRFSEADQKPACPTCNSPDTSKKLSTVAIGSSLSGSSGGSSSSCGSHGSFG
jgi:putative FmdB family regulatory protein